MDWSKTIIICVLYKIFGVDYVFSLPILGGEHVHIKVYLSPKHSTTRDRWQPENHRILHPSPRPLKKVPRKEIFPVLENFYLSELDKQYDHSNLHQHHRQEPKFAEETFSAETQANNPQAKDDAESSIGIRHRQETITAMESNQSHDDADQKLQHEQNIDHHTAAEENQGRQMHLEDVIKVIEAPKFMTSFKDLAHEPQANEVIVEEPKMKSSSSNRIENHKYDVQYASPAEKQYIHFQEVVIYREIPRTTRPGPGIDSSKQKTQSVEHTSAAAACEQQDTLEYVTDYEKYLPSLESPQSFRDSHQVVPMKSSANMNADNKDYKSHNEENPKAVETYMGYDSYSAGHVQGLGVKGYSNHKLF